VLDDLDYSTSERLGIFLERGRGEDEIAESEARTGGFHRAVQIPRVPGHSRRGVRSNLRVKVKKNPKLSFL
jgi:hypothetical protein